MRIYGDEDLWPTAELKAKLKSIGTSIASGTRQVSFQGQSVTYSSITEMRRVAGMIQDELERRESATGRVRRTKQIRIQTKNRGFHD